MTLDPQNRVMAAAAGGEIRTLIDADQNGIAESHVVFYANATNHFTSVTDILWIGTKLYVCSLGTVSTLEDTNADGVADVVTDIVTGIPQGFHQTNGLLFDPPNHLLISSGSYTDHGPEPYPNTAAILRCDLNGQNVTVHATGLRNTFRLARHPVTGDVFGGDNEWNGPPAPPLVGDEINRILAGADYGYPSFFGAPPNGSTSIGPVAILPHHAAPTGIAFNPNTRISGYRYEAYVTLFTQGQIASLIRIPIHYGLISGVPAGFAELFAQGFVNPIDVEFMPDGSVLVADFSAMNIHRIYPLTDAVMTIEAPPSTGTYCPVRLSSPSNPGATVYMGASLAPQPPVVLGTNLVVYLDAGSPVFTLSLTPGNPYFNFPIPGNLDASGEHLAGFFIPPLPSLAGLDVWLSFAVIGPGLNALATSPEQSVKIVPLW
jgi:glucose/arabinose dehydrogenase